MILNSVVSRMVHLDSSDSSVTYIWTQREVCHGEKIHLSPTATQPCNADRMTSCLKLLLVYHEDAITVSLSWGS
jgi:hypothetical protein